MSQQGKPSTAHEYDQRDQCIHCGTYRPVVDQLSLECKSWREAEQDETGKQKWLAAEREARQNGG